MRSYLLTTTLIVCFSMNVMADPGHFLQSNKRQCKESRCAATQINKEGEITQSGHYCLSKNIKGSIVIAANDVTLDLNSYIVKGSKNKAAISVKNCKNVSIKNGGVTNPTSVGIKASHSTGLYIENVQVYDCDQALLLSTCKDSTISSFRAYKNTNTHVDAKTKTGTSVILLDSCKNIDLIHVQANNNTKALNKKIGIEDPGMGIIAMINCGNINLKKCTTNNNSQTNNKSRFAPIVALFSENINLIDCQSNNNDFPVNDSLGFAPIHIRSCSDTVIDGCQANGNQLQSTSILFRPVYIIASPRNIIKNCQINNNIVQSLVDSGTTTTDLTGLFLYGLVGAQSDNHISNCQIAGNTVVNAGAAAIGYQLTGLFINGFTDPSGFENRTIIENCQISDNSFQTVETNQTSYGINLSSVEDVTISNCSITGNSGGENIFGILSEGSNRAVDGGEAIPQPNRKIKIINCNVSDLTARDFSAGIVLFGHYREENQSRSSSTNCQIIGCQINRNIAGTAGIGIGMQNVQSSLISDSQINQNSLSGLVTGANYFQEIDVGQINKDCTIINCTAVENGSNGFEIGNIGTTDNFLFKDNVALDNENYGFYDHSSGTNTRYIGNYGSNNGTANYSISSVTIQLFTLNSSGNYISVSGDSTHFSSLINIQSQ